MEGEEENQVVLIGTWASIFCLRVEVALKIKGIPYKYLEEDLDNKSDLLLHHNPVLKKVPVLLHHGKAIAESFVILEYIDEYWTNAPKLLPDDPFHRAKTRFWANYYDQKVLSAIWPIIFAEGRERKKAIEDYQQVLRVFEHGIERDFPEKSQFLDGENLGFLDVIIGSQACNYQAFHDTFDVIYEAEKNPVFFSWIMHLNNHPVIKDTLPPTDKLKALFKQRFIPPFDNRMAAIRDKYLQTPKA